MKIDPGVRRTREARHRISARHGHDTRRLIEHYRELEKQYADRLVRDSALGQWLRERRARG
jgi:hypothetical protein